MMRGTRSVRWLQARLRAGDEAELVLRGHSMSPTLVDGDRLLLTPLDGAPRPGDIVALVRAGHLVVHRLRVLDGGAAITRGDASATDDPPVPAAELLGVVKRVRRSPLRRLRLRVASLWKKR